jgi:hypothetical protein
LVQEIKNKFLQFYQRHEILVSVLVFLAGFLFDVFTLGRIDDLLNLIQQGIYILILGGLLLTEIKVRLGTITLTEKWAKFWQYHDLVVHFLFGSLLSAYTIFYYTSASALTSFLFLTMLVGLMLANEFPRFQKLGLPVRVVLFNICVLSYFAFLYPILMGRVGPLPFWLGFVSSALAFILVGKLNFQLLHESLKRHVILPSLAVHLFFLIGYYTALIPPVPVAVKKIGIYYNVIKEQGQYLGQHQNPRWNFWHRGAQEFKARPGDKVHVLLAIFSPARFEDRIVLRWFFKSERGWSLEDSIPLTILGGREQGFRGFGSKRNFRPGSWRVIVETSDGREVGRINFQIEQDESESEREFVADIF